MTRGKDIWLPLISLAFVAIGVFLLLEGDPAERVMALGATVFFGACALVGLMPFLPHQRAELDREGGLTIQPDRLQLVGMAIAAIGMALGCTLLAPLAAADNRPVVSIAGYIGGVFFGLGGLFMLWRVFTDKPLARIDRDGVRTFGLGAWSLAWEEIASVSSGAIANQPYIAFEVDLARAAPNLEAQYTVGAHGSRLRFEDLQSIVFELWRRHRDASAPAALQH
ncbi:MAG: hypothetical protein J0L81_05675 [Caulobacterales bacterium]|jgi:hypothetical protein|nr:hypothetical protein [Caulobacterales bacterium]